MTNNTALLHTLLENGWVAPNNRTIEKLLKQSSRTAEQLFGHSNKLRKAEGENRHDTK